MPYAVSLFGVSCIVLALASNLLFGRGCGPIGEMLGRFFMLVLLPGGLFYLAVSVHALLTTRYTEPFGTSAYDRFIVAGLKQVPACIALIVGLFLCLGCLVFL